MNSIIIRTDSSSFIGTGHVMRDLVLAQQLQQQYPNVHIIFATTDLPNNINNTILNHGYEVFLLTSPHLSEFIHFVHSINPILIVIDHYDIHYDDEFKIKQQTNAQLLVLDDLYMQHYCDILLNHNICADPTKYEGLIPSFCELRCGKQYTLIRDEFKLAKNARKALRNKFLTRVFIAIGGADHSNINISILSVLNQFTNIQIDIVTTNANANLLDLQTYCNQYEYIHLHVNTTQMAFLMANCDFAIISASVVANEAMYLGIPFIAIKTASNQEGMHHFLSTQNIPSLDRFDDKILTKEITTHMQKEKYLWIIGGGVLQEPLIAIAKTYELKTIVSDYNPKCYLYDKCDVFVNIDIYDIEAHINYIKNSSLNIVASIAAGIDVPELMAKINEFIGIKGVCFETALLVKNKDLFRLRLKELGYDTPHFEIITSQTHNIKSIINSFNYPVIVKPTNNCGSRDMKIFHEPNDALIAFIQSKLNKYSTILLEEMWNGKEQTVEAIIDINGDFHEGFITDRNFSFETHYPIETGLVHPSQLDSTTQKELFLLAKQVAKDLGIDIGIVKLDTIVTSTGPKIIELTVRNAGGYDPQFLVPYATGKNILKATIQTLLGLPIDPNLLKPSIDKFGVTGSIWPQPGVISEIIGLHEAQNIEGIKIFLSKNVGDTINEYIDCASRFIFILAIADSLQEAQQKLATAQSIMKVITK